MSNVVNSAEWYERGYNGAIEVLARRIVQRSFSNTHPSEEEKQIIKGMEVALYSFTDELDDGGERLNMARRAMVDEKRILYLHLNGPQTPPDPDDDDTECIGYNRSGFDFYGFSYSDE